MADYTFFTNPMSRGQIARWALHEAGANYEQVLVDWRYKDDLNRVNPMGKVPTIVHHHGDHDHIVTEAAAICHYLAEMSAPDLLPRDHEKADYFRWLFFAAGPVEQAVLANSMGWTFPEGREGMAGFGTFERAIEGLASLFDGRAFVCGDRFTMADVYVGSQIDWGLSFKSIPTRPKFRDYVGRIRDRDAYKAAKAIDGKLIADADAEG